MWVVGIIVLAVCLLKETLADFQPRNPIFFDEEQLSHQRRAQGSSPPLTPMLASLSKEVQSAFKLTLPSLFTFGDDLVSSTGVTIDCDFCQSALGIVRGATDYGLTGFENIVTEICTMAGVPRPECQGVVSQQAPYVLEALRSSNQLNGYTGQLFCNSVLNSCPGFVPKNVSLSFSSTQHTRNNNHGSKPHSPKIHQPKSSEPLTLLHISDIHYDPTYQQGSEANCSYALCCEDRTNPDGNKRNHPASTWGEFNCDTPHTLLESFLTTFQSVTGVTPDLSIFTGDIAPHNVWYDNQTTVLDSYRIFEYLKLLPNNLYSTVGNHDTSPLNLFQPLGLLKTGQKPLNNWVFNNLSDIWSYWLAPNAASMLETVQGVYSTRPLIGLKIINMNTNDCYALNTFLYYNDASQIDPNGQLQWIANELADSEANGEAVWLMGHLPPGCSDCIVPWSNAFQQIVERYSKTIRAQFYGHTHYDEFAVQYNHDKTEPISFQLLAPSLTPYSNLNAGYRIYKIDTSSFEILDSLTYFANISDSGKWVVPKWQYEYSARDYYPEWPTNSPLNATFWHTLVNFFEKDDKAFQKYYTRRSKSSTADVVCKSGQCKTKIIKNLRAGNSKDKYYPPVLKGPSLAFINEELAKIAQPSIQNKRHCGH
ncbi:Ppn1p [Sugiyamaella lignohabitans]|uniref:Sphingomyelin phosphodiesterase n=1 Tax=Sugiyamaella lignohabitans TaxID=796027 RepID=A0A167CXY4_9ASCO|nr:Ppn1p [Sugiyamaella lignohabitans]ANB12241.1 Ppn1p [Sugiyamaella lignohabitans]